MWAELSSEQLVKSLLEFSKILGEKIKTAKGQKKQKEGIAGEFVWSGVAPPPQPSGPIKQELYEGAASRRLFLEQESHKISQGAGRRS